MRGGTAAPVAVAAAAPEVDFHAIYHRRSGSGARGRACFASVSTRRATLLILPFRYRALLYLSRVSGKVFYTEDLLQETCQ